MSRSDDGGIGALLDHIRAYDALGSEAGSRTQVSLDGMDAFRRDSDAVASTMDMGLLPSNEGNLEVKVETKASADHALDLYASMQEVRLRDCPDPVREINTQIRKLRKRGWTIEPPTEE